MFILIETNNVEQQNKHWPDEKKVKWFTFGNKEEMSKSKSKKSEEIKSGNIEKIIEEKK